MRIHAREHRGTVVVGGRVHELLFEASDQRVGEDDAPGGLGVVFALLGAVGAPATFARGVVGESVTVVLGGGQGGEVEDFADEAALGITEVEGDVGGDLADEDVDCELPAVEGHSVRGRLSGCLRD